MVTEPTVSGTFRSLFLYDLSDEILLDKLRAVIGVTASTDKLTSRHLAPEYVRFERPPVTESRQLDSTEDGEHKLCRITYYDYGVISIEFELAFELPWATLVLRSAAWIAEQDTERRAAAMVDSLRDRALPALIKPYEYRLSEDYYILHICPILDDTGGVVTASELTAQYASELARIVRGESSPLAPEEQAEVLESWLSYYPNDLLVVGWSAALIYDTSEGAAPTIKLLEYANSQLLEFRHYDHVLSQLLEQVYDSFDSGSGFFSRWGKVREAERLGALRLDVRELTERADNSIKFLSDTFSARVYRLAAIRIGVPDYRKLVDEKLVTIGELYQFLMDRFHHGRAFALELMVVVILVIELAYLFRGKG